MAVQKHILILASWYPNPNQIANGNFIRQIAMQTALNYKVTVLHFNQQTVFTTQGLQINEKENELQEWIYFQKPKNKFFQFFSFFWSAYRLFKKIKKERGKIDYAHVQVVWPMGIVAWFYKHVFGVPYFVTEHWTGYLKQDYQLSPKIYLFSRWVFRHASNVFTVSEALGNAISATNLCTRRPEVWHNIVKPSTAPIESLVVPESIRFLHVSNFRQEQKNHLGILEAFSIFVSQSPNAQLHLVGYTNETKKEEIETYMLKLGIEKKNTVWTDFCETEQIREYMRESTALISFSNFETFALTCAEAAMEGTPCIYTACGGPEEFLQSNMGIQVPIGDIKSLANAMEQIANNPQMFDRESIRRQAEQIFDLENWNKQAKSTYK